MDDNLSENKLPIIIIVIFVLFMLLGCHHSKKIELNNDLDLYFDQDLLKIYTQNYTITITPYYKPLHDSDSNEAGDFLTKEDIIRNEAEFK